MCLDSGAYTSLAGFLFFSGIISAPSGISWRAPGYRGTGVTCARLLQAVARKYATKKCLGISVLPELSGPVITELAAEASL